MQICLQRDFLVLRYVLQHWFSVPGALDERYYTSKPIQQQTTTTDNERGYKILVFYFKKYEKKVTYLENGVLSSCVVLKNRQHFSKSSDTWKWISSVFHHTWKIVPYFSECNHLGINSNISIIHSIMATLFARLWIFRVGLCTDFQHTIKVSLCLFYLESHGMWLILSPQQCFCNFL